MRTSQKVFLHVTKEVGKKGEESRVTTEPSTMKSWKKPTKGKTPFLSLSVSFFLGLEAFFSDKAVRSTIHTSLLSFKIHPKPIVLLRARKKGASKAGDGRRGLGEGPTILLPSVPASCLIIHCFALLWPCSFSPGPCFATFLPSFTFFLFT